MKAIKRIIVLMIILIIGITIFIVVFNKQSEKKEELMGDSGEEVNYNSDELKDVTENIKFYTVNNCVNQYINTLNKNNSIYYEQDENRNFVKINENEIKKMIYNLLSVEYIQENNISIDNVYQYVDNIGEDLFFVPLKMKVVSKKIRDKYVVYGILQTMENEYFKDIYVSVNIDKQNQTFSIEPLQSYESIKDIIVQNNNKTIESNGENSYEDEKINYEYMVKKYIDVYKKLSLSNPEIAYEFLEEEYKTKRFGNLEKYKKYVESNLNEIKVLQPNKYLANQYEGYTEYVIQDKYQNLYIFNEYMPMDFSLKLDTYTIPTEKFKTEYNSSNDQNKIMLNVDKWIQMLNNRDYSAAYKVLDETFRNNNFGSEEKFEQYMREKFPLHYKLEFGEYSNEADIGMQKIILRDITGEDLEIIENTIIMQLKDDYDFVMSFEIK